MELGCVTWTSSSSSSLESGTENETQIWIESRCGRIGSHSCSWIASGSRIGSENGIGSEIQRRSARTWKIWSWTGRRISPGFGIGCVRGWLEHCFVFPALFSFSLSF